MDGPDVCVQGCDYPNLRGTSKDTNDRKGLYHGIQVNLLYDIHIVYFVTNVCDKV